MINSISIPSDKLKSFCAVLEAAQLVSLVENGVDCECNRNNCKTHFHVGGKYARVDIGTGGRYMVVLATGEIFGIKAYGHIHRGHYFGTLDTIDEWDWRNYRACRALSGFAKEVDEKARAHRTARMAEIKAERTAGFPSLIVIDSQATLTPAAVSALDSISAEMDNSTAI